jgi:hypothetical protein
MEHGDLVHAMVLEHLRKRLSREYKEIGINKKGEEKSGYEGHYPDMVLGNHGMVLALLKIETAESILEKEAEKWKTLSGLGVKLILMIPRDMKVRVTDLLWSEGLMDRVSIGTYEISVTMP